MLFETDQQLSCLVFPQMLKRQGLCTGGLFGDVIPGDGVGLEQSEPRKEGTFLRGLPPWAVEGSVLGEPTEEGHRRSLRLSLQGIGKDVCSLQLLSPMVKGCPRVLAPSHFWVCHGWVGRGVGCSIPGRGSREPGKADARYHRLHLYTAGFHSNSCSKKMAQEAVRLRLDRCAVQHPQQSLWRQLLITDPSPHHQGAIMTLSPSRRLLLDLV